jgi:crotonobetainyl-CoA:carnitine CoA-transferase CaiB-like acyl-CoA transferase
MTRPFEGISIIDITHVLAGPFAAYQLAVLGADVIKVEHPDEPDQSSILPPKKEDFRAAGPAYRRDAPGALRCGGSSKKTPLGRAQR